MESALLSLISLVFIVFAFGIGLAIVIFRTVVEKLWKLAIPAIPDRFEKILTDIWNEWILPAAPIIIGALAAYFLTDYPYPTEFASSNSGRIFFGLIAGFFSGSVYRFAKFHIKKYLPQAVQEKVDSLENQLPKE